MNRLRKISGNIIDPLNLRQYSGTIWVEKGRISKISEDRKNYSKYIIPGFIDSHVHIESSLLTPREFARLAVIHGTLACLADMHDLVNVLGIKAFDYLQSNLHGLPFYFYFSCPFTNYTKPQRSGEGYLNMLQVKTLLRKDDIKFLGETTLFPNAKFNEDFMDRINLAHRYNKAIDGHAPETIGKKVDEYLSLGITTDHESVTEKEALDKLKRGMKVIIREGSVAKNLNDLFPVINKHFMNLMFCSDDISPLDLLNGHINLLVKKAIKDGADPMKVLRISSVNPVFHYKLETGLIRVGDSADFLLVDNLKNLNIIQNVVKGEVVAEEGRSYIDTVSPKLINNFHLKMSDIKKNDFKIGYKNRKVNVIQITKDNLITRKIESFLRNDSGFLASDIKSDKLKIVVINRYKTHSIKIGFVKGFGLKNGAIASSVSHDHHNIVAVGVNDKEILKAISLIISSKGGLSIVSGNYSYLLPLKIGGLVSNKRYEDVIYEYVKIRKYLSRTKSKISNPFMVMSFLTLEMIPDIRITDQVLFDSKNFKEMELYLNSPSFIKVIRSFGKNIIRLFWNNK